jgi:RHS repeat-associated protein
MKKGVIVVFLVLVLCSSVFAISIKIDETKDVPMTDSSIHEGIVPEKLREKVTRHVYGLGHVADITNGEITYLHQDRLGSTRLITDSSGEVVGEFKSLPFGQEIVNDDVRFAFTGKELDSSGLYYFGARYYDPNVGRFTSVDPVRSNHAYSYVNNNPMNFVDPSGMDYGFVGPPEFDDFVRNWNNPIEMEEVNVKARNFEGSLTFDHEFVSYESYHRSLVGTSFDFMEEAHTFFNSDEVRDFSEKYMALIVSPTSGDVWKVIENDEGYSEVLLSNGEVSSLVSEGVLYPFDEISQKANKILLDSNVEILPNRHILLNHPQLGVFVSSSSDVGGPWDALDELLRMAINSNGPLQVSSSMEMENVNKRR